MKNRVSQKDMVLKELRETGSVGRNWALQRYISRLGAIMLQLKRGGMSFETKWVDGDYVYVLKDLPKDTIFYRVGGKLVAKKVIW